MSVLDDVDKKKINELKKYVSPRVMPVCQSVLPKGTASLVVSDEGWFFISNYHVLYDVKNHQLFKPLEFVLGKEHFPLDFPYVAKKHPVDVAVVNVDWMNQNGFNFYIPISKFANHCLSVDEEIFLIVGYPSALQTYNKNEHDYNHIQILLLGHKVDLESDNSFVIECPELFNRCGRSIEGIEGLSGSLVWNTKIIECKKNDIDWSPDKAAVAGIVCKWGAADEKDVERLDRIICTKVEKMCVTDLFNYWKAHSSDIHEIATI